MKMYVLIALLVVGLALWGYGLWRRGFFGPETLPVERYAYAARNVLWFVSILIVSWPLQLYRPSIGSTAYVVIAVVVLAVFFLLGLLAQRIIFKRFQTRQGGA